MHWSWGGFPWTGWCRMGSNITEISSKRWQCCFQSLKTKIPHFKLCLCLNSNWKWWLLHWYNSLFVRKSIVKQWDINGSYFYSSTKKSTSITETKLFTTKRFPFCLELNLVGSLTLSWNARGLFSCWLQFFFGLLFGIFFMVLWFSCTWLTPPKNSLFK